MTVEDIRALCLSLPEAQEHPHFDRASFRVRGKIFVTLPPGDARIVLKLPVEIKDVLRDTDAEAWVSLGGWDKGGWTQLEIGRMESEKLADLVRLAWRRVAPKALLRGGMT